LNEASIPAWRQLRSVAVKVSSGITGQDLDPWGASRPTSRGLQDDIRSRESTPGQELTELPPIPRQNVGDALQPGCSTNLTEDAVNTERPTPTSVPTHLSPTPSAKLESVAEGAKEGCAQEQLLEEDPSLPLKVLGHHGVENTTESRSGSPGVDPEKAIPITAEDVANLSEPLINGSQDEHHDAATEHLPPKAEQEEQLREREESVGNQINHEPKERTLSISLPPHTVRNTGEPMSSPGSTVDAQSATTPALHEASTDTSPDNEGSRYNLDRADEKDDEPQTPRELAPSREEILEKEEHDKLLKAQMGVAPAELLGSSPTAADAQLRLEEEQAASASQESENENENPQSNQLDVVADHDSSSDDVNGSSARPLTQDTGELVQDDIDDEDDEVVGVPTPEDEKGPNTEVVVKPVSSTTDEATENTVTTTEPMVVDSVVVGAQSADITTVSGAPVPSKDTVEEITCAEKLATGHKEAPSTAMSTSSPRRTSVATVPTPSTERMTTRVSSGAMRHKSVSEILGEIPRPNTTPSSERTGPGKSSTDLESTAESNSQSRATTPQSPASRMRSMAERAREKERSKLNTVVFAKQQSDRTLSSLSAIPHGAKSMAQDSGEYFMPLILAQAYNATRGIQPLESLLQSAHKTITTSNSYIPFHDHQTQKVLRRIHALQSMDRWSFRQPKRSPEPNRPVTHWDELLKETRWMRTDFREERKWKVAIARNLAYACAEWIAANDEDRKLLQVKAVIPTKESVDVEMGDIAVPSNLGVSSSTLESDGFDEEPCASLLDAVAPTALFSLTDADVVFGLKRSPATDRLLDELPMYGSPLNTHQADLPTSDIDPDASWRRPALLLNKYIGSKIVLKEEGPPKKRGRYQYEEEDSEDDQIMFDGQAPKRTPLEPILVDVALFNPENKHIRDRIYAGHQFRPPSEYPMPLQSFFECRGPSQWTCAEEDELKGLVREYSYNWQLISSILSSRSLFSSSAERRTPWECFEQWIHLEGLPADMQKTPYFKAYNNRLNAAKRTLPNEVPPQLNTAGAALTPVRWRSTTTGVRVEKRRNQKHLTLVDAMRKLAKKRETSLQKQQHAANLAAMRKANEVPQPQGVRHTPQDFSRLKHERELQLQERLTRLQLQQEAQRRVS
jgi:chromatin modification-related protein VID21